MEKLHSQITTGHLEALSKTEEIKAYIDVLLDPKLRDLSSEMREERFQAEREKLEGVLDRGALLSVYWGLRGLEIRMGLAEVDLDEREECLKECKDLEAQARVKTLKVLLHKVHELWTEKKWTDAKKVIRLIYSFVEPEDLHGAKQIVRELALTVELPWSFLATHHHNKETSEFKKLREWRATLSSPFFLETFFQRALACYLSFEAEGLAEAVSYSQNLQALLEKVPRGKKEGHIAELRALADCLELKALVRLAFCHNDPSLCGLTTQEEVEEQEKKVHGPFGFLGIKFTLSDLSGKKFPGSISSSGPLFGVHGRRAGERLALWARHKEMESTITPQGRGGFSCCP